MLKIKFEIRFILCLVERIIFNQIKYKFNLKLNPVYLQTKYKFNPMICQIPHYDSSFIVIQIENFFQKNYCRRPLLMTNEVPLGMGFEFGVGKILLGASL